MKSYSYEPKDTRVLTKEDMYQLTGLYVTKFYFDGSYPTLQRIYSTGELEDLIHEVYAKLLQLKLHEKFNPEVTSAKYHVYNAVRTKLIDILRKYREHLSMDKENEQGSTFGDMIESHEYMEEQTVGSTVYQSILEILSDETNSKVVGVHPRTHKAIKFTQRQVAILLGEGYKIKDISAMYTNPDNGKSITSSSISRIKEQIQSVLVQHTELFV